LGRSPVDDRHKQVLIGQFISLLKVLNDGKSKVCIRFRKSAEPWSNDFLRVNDITPDGAIFFNTVSKTYVYISELERVAEFELDKRLANFDPHVRYAVAPVKFI
jgi:hypothetical protein